MRLSLLNLILVLSLIGVSAGWMFERRNYDSRFRSSELTLAKWLPQQRAVRIAWDWKYHHKGDGSHEAFDSLMRLNLISAIEQAYTLETELRVLGYGDESLALAKESAELLDCKSESELLQLLEELYDDVDLEEYPRFLQQGTTEFEDFKFFLGRVFDSPDTSE